MGEAKRRGSFEERKETALREGRNKTELAQKRSKAAMRKMIRDEMRRMSVEMALKEGDPE
jgi:hypothetical protein